MEPKIVKAKHIKDGGVSIVEIPDYFPTAAEVRIKQRAKRAEATNKILNEILKKIEATDPEETYIIYSKALSVRAIKILEDKGYKVDYVNGVYRIDWSE